MNRNEFYSSILEIILQIQEEVSEKDLIENSNALVDDGILDSISVVELCAILEEKYDFEISLDDMDKSNFNSIEEIVNLMMKYI